MDAAAFVDKWRESRRTERSASQEHFLDLCEVLKHPKPGAVDPKGLTFTTERRVKKEGGKHGFADQVSENLPHACLHWSFPEGVSRSTASGTVKKHHSLSFH